MCNIFCAYGFNMISQPKTHFSGDSTTRVNNKKDNKAWQFWIFEAGIDADIWELKKSVNNIYFFNKNV